MTILVSIDLKTGILRRYFHDRARLLTNVARMAPWAELPLSERVIVPEDVEIFRANPPVPNPVVA